MSELEEKLGAVLNNPQLMQQILSMAQAMGTGQPQQAEEPKQAPKPQAPEFSPQLMRSIAGLAQQTGVDRNQQALLKALSPYLSRDRVSKLERAMRAAKMAGAASAFLNSGGLAMLQRR